MRTGVRRNLNADEPPWEFRAARYQSVRSILPSCPTNVIDCGSFIVTNVSRPPRSAPAVSK
jgi:hypothetical protein